MNLPMCTPRCRAGMPGAQPFPAERMTDRLLARYFPVFTGLQVLEYALISWVP